MKTVPHPRGDAYAIAEARAQGLKPAGVVLVALAGRVHWDNPTVYANPEQPYRWDWLRGLSVVVLMDRKTRLGNILADILGAKPEQLDVIDHERRLGWLVLEVIPRLVKVRWAPSWVADWLGDSHLHDALHTIKREAAQQEQAERAAKALVREVEAVWN